MLVGIVLEETSPVAVDATDDLGAAEIDIAEDPPAERAVVCVADWLVALAMEVIRLEDALVTVAFAETLALALDSELVATAEVWFTLPESDDTVAFVEDGRDAREVLVAVMFLAVDSVILLVDPATVALAVLTGPTDEEVAFCRTVVANVALATLLLV